MYSNNKILVIIGLMTFTIYIICYNISYMLLMCMPYWLIAVCCGRCQELVN